MTCFTVIPCKEALICLIDHYLMYCVIRLEGYKYIEWWLEWNFKGNSWELLVCKDVWNPYWLVSWNSNNHSHSDRVEWIMSWGVAGGPSLWTWSSPRREGDLPWERSGDNPLCPDSAEFGNRCRCKPPRAPMLLTQSGYRV